MTSSGIRSASLPVQELLFDSAVYIKIDCYKFENTWLIVFPGGEILVLRRSQKIGNLLLCHSHLYSLIGSGVYNVGAKALNLAGTDNRQYEDNKKNHSAPPRCPVVSAQLSGGKQAGDDYNDSESEKYRG